jgi:hypothetical protein
MKISPIIPRITHWHYTQPSNVTNTAISAEAHMAPAANYANDILEYGSAVGQTTAGVFNAVICEQATAASTAALTAGDLTTPAGDGTAACAAASVARPVQ